MATFSRPGVYVREVSLPQPVQVGNGADAAGAIVGTFEKGPLEPTVVTSWTAFTNIYGGLNAAYPSTYGAFQFFSNGGRDLFVLRVINGGTTSSVTLTDSSADDNDTLLVVAASPGTWGDSLAVEVRAASAQDRFNLVVYGAPITASATSNVLEQFTDLSMDPTDVRYAPAVINTLSKYIQAGDEGSPATGEDKNPLPAGLKPLVGGANGTTVGRLGYSTALSKFDVVDRPLVFNLPDWAYHYTTSGSSQARSDVLSVYADLLAYCEGREDAFAILDTPAGLTAAEAITFAGDAKTAFAAGATGANGAFYYPWINIPDTTRGIPGAVKTVAPGAAMVGVYLATDSSRGVFKSPAGFGTRVALAVAPERALSNVELDNLNTASVPLNAIRVVPGAGIVVMGARTCRPTVGERYINVRRSLIYLKKQMKDLSAFAVFENNDEQLWSQIRTVLGNFLRNYWAQGGLRGTDPSEAFFVKCDEETITPADILNGRVNIEVGVAVEYPAEFVVITVSQLTGSSSVAN